VNSTVSLGQYAPSFSLLGDGKHVAGEVLPPNGSGVSANVSFSGITEAGLYQINLTVPPNTGNGDEPVQATFSGIKTPPGPVVTVQ